jgi:hypothetical protein
MVRQKPEPVKFMLYAEITVYEANLSVRRGRTDHPILWFAGCFSIGVMAMYRLE